MKTFNNGFSKRIKKIDFWISFIPLLLCILITLFIAILAKLLPPRLPFFYSLPWGEKQLGSREQLLILPASITLVVLCNLIISWQLHSSQKIFKKILVFSSLLVSLILTVTFFKIILIFL